MKRRLAILGAAICIGTIAPAAYAHHSHGYVYDWCKSITIEGRVESVQWKDPHTIVVVKGADDTAYTVDWNGLAALTRNKVLDPAKAALVSGARVAVTGSPIRTAAQIREHFPDFNNDVNPRTIDPRSIRRVDDTFNWELPAGSGPPCDKK